jgi:hypothetical protein
VVEQHALDLHPGTRSRRRGRCAVASGWVPVAARDAAATHADLPHARRAW